MATHHAKILDVADRHRHRIITLRLPEELRAKVRAFVDGSDMSLNALVAAFLRWYVGDTDDLPKRPPRKRSG